MLETVGELPSRPADPSSPAADFTRLIENARDVLSGLGDAFSPAAESLLGLARRAASGTFHLAVLGQFKRGKSTLLNALLGTEVLPSSLLPLTAIPTFIRWGRNMKASVSFSGGGEPASWTGDDAGELRAFLERFVTEKGNPENRLDVAAAEITLPADILRSGVVLIDTPGVGSTFRHNTETTLNFLPQCDAALFVLSPDPPVTEAEIEFLRRVRSKMERIFFVLNKADRLSGSEREMAEDFVRKVVEEHFGKDEWRELFTVSAARGLEAKKAGDPDGWERSGMARVERSLVLFLAGEKSRALHEALSRKAADILSDSLMRTRLNLRSLQLPLEDVERKLRKFETAISEIRRRQLAARDLLAGDRRRMHEFLEDHAGELRSRAWEFLSSLAREKLSGLDRPDQEALQNTLDDFIPGYFEKQLSESTSLFKKRMEEALRPHRETAARLIREVRDTAADLFDIPSPPPSSEDAFEMVRKPSWITHKWATRLSPVSASIIDRLVPDKVRRKRIIERSVEQINTLVVRNVENLRWALFQSIDHTFERFGNDLSRRLDEAVAATEGAVRAALRRRREHGENLTPEISRLRRAAAGMERILRSLRPEPA